MKQNLKSLIQLLENCNKETNVYYTVGDLAPCGLDSYRGYYEELALGYGNKNITVGELIELLKSAIGKTFTGWKGGEFKMNEMTSIYCANAGSSGGSYISGVTEYEYQVILSTDVED
jgi:hypothetical protein